MYTVQVKDNHPQTPQQMIEKLLTKPKFNGRTEGK